jgi:hypothetical protein
MDARLDPAKFAGLLEEDAHVIRNAGGRASDDAIRSLVMSHKLLGTQEWFVIHHTDCGMETFADEVMRSLRARTFYAEFPVQSKPSGGSIPKRYSHLGKRWMIWGNHRHAASLGKSLFIVIKP